MLNCRQRRSIVSVAEYETDRESLRRMLADFQDDYLAKHKVSLSQGRHTMLFGFSSFKFTSILSPHALSSGVQGGVRYAASLCAMTQLENPSSDGRAQGRSPANRDVQAGATSAAAPPASSDASAPGAAAAAAAGAPVGGENVAAAQAAAAAGDEVCLER
jgi:hypothetical protein